MNKNKKPRMTKKDMETAKRLLKYVTEKYKLSLSLYFSVFLSVQLRQLRYPFLFVTFWMILSFR